MIFFIMIGVGIAAAVVAGIVGFALAALAGGFSEDMTPEGPASVIAIAGVFVTYMVVYIALFAAFQALYFRVVYSNIEFDQNLLRTSVTLGGWFWIVLTNSVLLLITLGIYYPWASVRMTRYIQDNLWVEAEDLDSFVAHEADSASAVGEEIGEAFDLGIGI